LHCKAKGKRRRASEGQQAGICEETKATGTEPVEAPITDNNRDKHRVCNREAPMMIDSSSESEGDFGSKECARRAREPFKRRQTTEEGSFAF
jgi:hypothetical protein